MEKLIRIISFGCIVVYILSCGQPRTANEQTTSESAANHELAEYISKIKAVDNHAHPTTIDPNDQDYDALPLGSIFPFELPVRVRPDGPQWLAAAKAVYGSAANELNEKALKDLADTAANAVKQKGEKFPEWALDQSGIEVMLGNRITMGPGLSSPRFRWVSYVDALLYPLSTKAEAAVSPDREKLFPLEEQLLKKYLADLNISKLPATLDEYLKQVVTPTLEAQKKGGCLALKFEAAYLRSLDFTKTTFQSASEVYAKHVKGGEPSHEHYKMLQDFIFYYIAKEAGRLGLAIHIHSYPAAGNYFIAAGCDPLLLEPVFNDSELRSTKFVLIHGGGTFSHNTTAMLWKPNVYADLSALTLLWSADQLATVLKEWLSQFPEKVVFGTDASSLGPGLGWEMGAWIACTTGKQALTMALGEMIRNNEITLPRAKEIATMVLRTNASNLYSLGLK